MKQSYAFRSSNPFGHSRTARILNGAVECRSSPVANKCDHGDSRGATSPAICRKQKGALAVASPAAQETPHFEKSVPSEYIQNVSDA